MIKLFCWAILKQRRMQFFTDKDKHSPYKGKEENRKMYTMRKENFTIYVPLLILLRQIKLRKEN
jgi:hypothetical protein